ncbi:hypothetical protein VB620_09970 [Nodularia harveyana UHCC-0300]|uniref:Outer membrane protein beta-barrel domain-containing protein n=1 Tax=Nodularia harveyana UHCC-0300 TaxID=2974287 RepID=A0ABU5UDR3_9CYAN|nr:hypothetical protein [Nodularia harveyana]MEA5581665.1 hypothetical protein [Nodularia harveyana UHCC-0300]
MDKIQKKTYISGNLKFINLNYICWSLQTTLATFIMLLLSLLIKPVLAGEIADNQPTQLNLENPPSTLSLRERLLEAKKNQVLPEIQPNSHKGFPVKIQPETFDNSFSEENPEPELSNVSETKERLIQQLLSQPKTNLDSSSQEPTIREIESSESVEESDKVLEQLLISPIITREQQLIKRRGPKAFPGSTAGTPSGYGASAGQFYVGVGVLFPLDEDSDGYLDGSYGAGFGLGNPYKSVGLEVNVNFSSSGGDFLKGGEFDVGSSGYLGLKLHKYFSDGTAMAVGWSNALKWGESSGNKDTIYGVVTKAFPLQPNNPNHKLPLTISVGIGNGGFRSLDTRETDENDVNIFGSVGLRVLPQISLVSSWTGNRLNVGSSIAPFKNLPLIINGIFTDVTSNFDTGLGFSLSAGYSFRF